MPAVPKSLLLMMLPVLALVAACEPAPYHPGEAVSAAPPPPALPGALGVPVAGDTAMPYSGGTVAPGIAPATPMRLSATDIAATLANNTAEGVSSNGLAYAAYFSPEGRERFREGTFSDVGTWRVLPDGRFCSTLVRVSGNVEQCYVMYRSGNAVTYQRPDGVTIGTVTVVPGNPQGL